MARQSVASIAIAQLASVYLTIISMMVMAGHVVRYCSEL